LAAERRSFWSGRRWLLWAVGGVLAAAAVLTVVAVMVAQRAEPYLRARLVAGLSAHFHARVELDHFHVSMGNSLHGEWGLWAQGRGLRIWPPAQVAGVGVPVPQGAGEPLIQVAEFRFHVPLRYHQGQPVHVSAVELKGLEVDLPPHSHFLHPAGEPRHGESRLKFSAVRVDRVESTRALLVLETDKPGKVPTEVAIAHLKLTGITPEGAMHFEAELTNPKPVGTIHTSGEFGPWNVEDPGQSLLTGAYRFTHADLSDFHGIAGMLSSTGTYAGTLRSLEVRGETDTPDFRLTHAGNAMDLKTQFRAQVDATNGDTHLEDVEATLGSSHIRTSGQVVRVLAETATGATAKPPHSIGHDIALKVRVEAGRVEDFLRLAMSDSAPLMTGNLAVTATLHIPPGHEPVHLRMATQGQYTLTDARFASAKVQGEVTDLSVRAQGEPGEKKTADPASILSQMQGHFQIANGVLTLPDLSFTVPGAEIHMSGTYALDGGTLHFAGVARTKATVSAMVGGWKGLLLKPADKLFERGSAGAVIPIHLNGTPSRPDFGIDLNRLKTTSPVNPATQQ
jgi:AsmA-like C-terminal region